MGPLSCSSHGSASDEQDRSLSGKHEGYFRVGAAGDSRSHTTHADLLLERLNSIMTENEMKFDALEPGEGVFRFDTADSIVSFAVDNGMAVRGHVLVWHRQTPLWLFQGQAGDDTTWPREFSSGRTDFPLLLDAEHHPKLTFDVMDS